MSDERSPPADVIERLSGKAYERVWSRCRDALERSGGSLTGTVGLASIDHREADAVAALIGGRRRAGSSPRLSLSKIDVALRAGALGMGLVEWLEELGGPLADRPAERARSEQRRTEPWALVPNHRFAGTGWFDDWVDEMRSLGTLLTLAPEQEAELLADALAVLDRLHSRWTPATAFAATTPTSAALPLAVLSAEVLGDPKALAGPCGTVVLRALAHRFGRDVPLESTGVRSLWASAGVAVDDVSSRVLLLGEASVPGAAGVPRSVTLAEIEQSGSSPSAGLVRVCENPAVLMAAARHGDGHHRVVCTEGQPSDACRLWLQRLVDAGCELAYHGDFDWPGVLIAHQVIERFGASAYSWRFDAAGYEAAVASLTRTVALSGRRVETPWDLDLADVMERHGRRVYEEQVVADLLADLDN